MAKSILDRAVSVDPIDIGTITATMYAECKDCQSEWVMFDQWFRERKDDRTIPFHWSIACCPKHAEVIRCFIEGVEPKEKDRTLIDIDIDIANLEVRIDNGYLWLGKQPQMISDHILQEDEYPLEVQKVHAAIEQMIIRKNELEKEWQQLYYYLRHITG